MQISDLISIVGILLAIIAFISENERLFIWNKFSNTDRILIIVSFIFIHYLLFYEWFWRNISILKKINFNNFPYPSTWAYLFSLCILIWILCKIFIADFPKENNKKVLEYYEFLLNKKEFGLLFSLIKKYNYNLLVKNTDQLELDREKLVYLIFSNKRFLESTAEFNFDFFNTIINNQILQKELIENYIESQLLNENSFFNGLNIGNDRIRQLSIILSKVDNSSHIINECIRKSKINYKSVIHLVFEYYKTDQNKSYNHIVESWYFIVKNNNIIGLKLYTKLILSEIILFEDFNEIINKITSYFSQIEVQNDSILDEILCSYLNILNKCYELNTDFNIDMVIAITKSSKNKLPEKLYNYYFNNYDSKNKNLDNLIKLIANE